MNKVVLRTDIVNLIKRERGLALVDIYDEKSSAGGVRIPGTISRATLRRILKGEPVDSRFAGILASKLRIYNSQWLVEPKEVPLRSAEFYFEETYESESHNLKVEVPLDDGISRIRLSDDLPLPTSREMKESGHELVGKWWSYHWTRKNSEYPTLIEGELDIEPNGYCSLRYSGSGLKYEGVLYLEDYVRFLLILDSKRGRISERLVCRYDYPALSYPLRKHTNELYGSWMGIDFNRDPCGSRTLLSQSQIDPETATEKLDQLEPIWIESKLDYGKALHSEFHEEWSTKRVIKLISKCRSDSNIRLLSTFFPEARELYNCFCRRASELRSSKSRKNRLKIKMGFLDYRSEKLIEARFKHYHLEDRRSDPSQSNFDPAIYAERIRRCALLFHDLKRDYEDVLDVEVVLYEAWPYAHFYQVGSKEMQIGFLMPTQQATTGPCVVIRNPKSPSWRAFEKNFNTVFEAGKSIDEVLGKESKVEKG